jgi:methylenetetrahydrofolate dehydrogenase (NADP+)/methenyltetrahydrofolate cyclohydrolase
MTHIIDGKAYAERLRGNITQRVAALKAEHGITPGLAVILVGDNPASEVYVRNKKTQTVAVGMQSFDHHLPATATQSQLLALIHTLNNDSAVHGILVQLPLPSHISERAVLEAIAPTKDVDGFHVVNVGKLATGQADALVSCTPLGCLMLLNHYYSSLAPHPALLAGKHAMIIGRSNIVGKPMAQLLLNQSCTVTICHSRTHNIQSITRQADILIAAVGKSEMVKADWVKKGAVVIDVGINRVDGKLVGDVDFNAVAPIASAITPVPGGVGPMTIACLLRNTLQAACAIHGVEFNAA